jgi:hypothetical protein
LQEEEQGERQVATQLSLVVRRHWLSAVPVFYEFVQRELQPRLEKVCARLGLTKSVNSGTDGSEFLDYDISGSAEEISDTVRSVLREVFGVEDDASLSFESNGFSLNGA